MGPPTTLNNFLDETAAKFPAKTALVTETGDWIFARLREQVLKAAAAFHARGVRKGDCVAIVLRNSPEFIITYFALTRLGAVAVPINFLVTKSEELSFMLDDCGAVGVVTQKDFLTGLLEARSGLPRLRSVWATDFQDPVSKIESFQTFVDAGDPNALPQTEVSPGDLAAILYTSGTTGTPKGAMLSHANMTSNCDAALRVFAVDAKDAMLTILPMFHTFAWTTCVLTALRAGIKNVLAPSITPANPWLKQMGRQGVTIFIAVPPVYAVLAKSCHGFKSLVLRYWFFRKVRCCVSGAAPLSMDTIRAFQKALGFTIVEGYGLTETSPIAALNAPGALRPGTVGRPLPGVDIKIVRDDESPLPAGEEGEVCIQGPNVMLGYHKRPQETLDAFTKDGWLKTGDIGVFDADGFLSLRDRKKDMIIIKGLKVFSAQVEAVIAEHPDVLEAAVIGIPHTTGDEVIKAFVVLKKGAAADKPALLKYCRQKLDPYKRPRDLEIVDALPKNALQKVLKRVLRRQELERAR